MWMRGSNFSLRDGSCSIPSSASRETKRSRTSVRWLSQASVALTVAAMDCAGDREPWSWMALRSSALTRERSLSSKPEGGGSASEPREGAGACARRDEFVALAGENGACAVECDFDAVECRQEISGEFTACCAANGLFLLFAALRVLFEPFSTMGHDALQGAEQRLDMFLAGFAQTVGELLGTDEVLDDIVQFSHLSLSGDGGGHAHESGPWWRAR